MSEQELQIICTNFQFKLESLSAHSPSGVCYLVGHCLTEIFQKKGFSARKVSGSLALVDKNGKYCLYGNHRLKNSTRVGVYHTWCEVNIDGVELIVDPSLKYNLETLKSQYNIKPHSKIPGSLISSEKSTYFWKYIENKNLETYSEEFLAKTNPDLIEELSTISTEGSEDF